MNQDFITKAARIVEENSIQGGEYRGQICVLSLIDDEGFPTSSILTPSKADGINWITFCTLMDENRAKRSIRCKRASVCFGTTAYCINLVGEIEIIASAEMKNEMWYGACKNWFTGIEDPNYVVLRFKTKRYKFFFNGEEVGGELD